MTPLQEHLRARVVAGRKLLVPYVMAGVPAPEAFPHALTAVGAAADAVEVGLPYSDPLVDGPVIAEAGRRALATGLRPLEALDLAGAAPAGPPRLVMTYYNPVYRCGERAFCRRARLAGYGGLIVPDVPHEESDGLRGAAADEGLAWVGLVAPTSSPGRVATICESATGFVYAVSTLGVTGERRELSGQAERVVAACRAATDLPVLLGFGVSTPQQAGAAARLADGVIVGSAIVRLLLEGGLEPAVALLAGIRTALDGERAA